MLMTILLTVLFILFVLMLLAALVYTLVRLVNNAGTHDAVAAGYDRQQPFLKASVCSCQRDTAGPIARRKETAVGQLQRTVRTDLL